MDHAGKQVAGKQAQAGNAPQGPFEDIHGFLKSGVFDRSAPLTILEIGSHVGHDSWKMHQTFPNARIICFEPDPRNIYIFKQTELDKVFELVEAAVSDTDGTATFYLSGGLPPKLPKNAFKVGWTASSSLKKPDQVMKVYPWMNFDKQAKVKTVRLDTFAKERGLGTIDFVWADVQGAEGALIEGGRETLARTRYFFTEFNFEKLYEGELTFEQVVAKLPGEWELIQKWKWDALFRNKALK